jgi:hypothetical protein
MQGATNECSQHSLVSFGLWLSYVSDDGGSAALTPFALMEAAKFASH